MQGMILTLICFVTWIQHTSCIPPQSLRECNVTNDDSVLFQLKGDLFTHVEPNETRYYFSVCGLKLPANDSITGPTPPILLRKKPNSTGWESLASTTDRTHLIRKSGRSYLKVSQGDFCHSLISMQCGLTVNMLLIVLDEKQDAVLQSPYCLRILEVYHPSLCSSVLRPRVWGIILGCTVVLLLLYCLLGLVYQKTIRKRSWHDSIPHVTVLDRIGARFANGLKHLRPHRVAYRQMQYIRVPPVKDESAPATPPNEPKEATPFVRSQARVLEEDPQDDLLLCL